jgi:hypothetical protein
MPPIQEEEGNSEAEAGNSEAEAEFLQDEQREAALQPAATTGEAHVAASTAAVAGGVLQPGSGIANATVENQPEGFYSPKISGSGGLPSATTSTASFKTAECSAAEQLQQSETIAQPKEVLPAVGDNGGRGGRVRAECNAGIAPPGGERLAASLREASGSPGGAVHHTKVPAYSDIKTESGLAKAKTWGTVVQQMKCDGLVPISLSDEFADGSQGGLGRSASSTSTKIRSCSNGTTAPKSSGDRNEAKRRDSVLDADDTVQLPQNAAADALDREPAPGERVTSSTGTPRGSEWFASNAATSLGGVTSVVGDDDDAGDDALAMGVRSVEIRTQESIRCISAMQLYQLGCAEVDGTFISGPDEIQDVLGVQRTGLT